MGFSPFLIFSPFLLFGGATVCWLSRPVPAALSLRELRELRNRPVTPIAEARAGRIKLVGRARGEQTAQSAVGGAPYLVLRRTFASSDGNMMSWHQEEEAFPFTIDDGTGRMEINPKRARLDLEVVGTEQATVRTEVFRNGDTLAVLGDIAPGTGPDGDGRIAFARPPLVSWRDPDTIPALPVPLGRLLLTSLSALVSVAGLAGSAQTLLFGDALDREVWLGMTAIFAAGGVYAAIRWWLRREE